MRWCDREVFFGRVALTTFAFDFFLGVFLAFFGAAWRGLLRGNRGSTVRLLRAPPTGSYPRLDAVAAGAGLAAAFFFLAASAVVVKHAASNTASRRALLRIGYIPRL